MSPNLYGQNGFISANHSYDIVGNEFTLFSETSFSIGYANTCPSLDTIAVSTINSIISIDLFFDLRGAWPQSGCTTLDTSSLIIDTNFNVIIINLNTIEYGNSINDSIINNVQTDTLVEKPLGLSEKQLDKIFIIFPNPAKDVLQIEVSEEVQFESIKLFGISGKTIKTLNASERNMDITGLSSGTYFLKLLTQEGILTKKVIIE